jgi:hypothetical protein
MRWRTCATCALYSLPASQLIPMRLLQHVFFSDKNINPIDRSKTDKKQALLIMEFILSAHALSVLLK